MLDNQKPRKNLLLKKLNDIEVNMIKSNDFDYNRVMSDIEFELEKAKKMKANERKRINNAIKEKRKLRQMSEYRESCLQEKINKIEQKQNNLLNHSSNISKSKSLPPIKMVTKKLKEIQDEEDEFAEYTEKMIKERLDIFSKNREHNLAEIEKKYSDLNKRNESVTENYNLYYQRYCLEKEEALKNKKIDQIQNYKDYQLLINIPKKQKKQKFIQKMKEFKERQKENEEEEDIKKKQLIQKIKNKSTINNITNERIQLIKEMQKKKNTFAGFQKANLEKIKEEIKERNDFLLRREFDIFNWVKDVDYKEEKYKQDVQRSVLITQSELNKKVEEMQKTIQKLKGSNILKKSRTERIQLYIDNKKREDERKEKEFLDKLKAEGKL